MSFRVNGPGPSRLEPPVYKPNKPRFGAKLPNPTKAADGLYRFANGFLTMHERALSSLSGKKGAGAQLGRWAANNLLDHDYRAYVPLPYLGKIFVEPPMGGLSFYILPAVFVTRTYNAIKRAMNKDYREVRDIIIRDVPSMAILVYAQPFLIRRFTEWMQNRRGIQLLTHTGSPYSFDALEAAYDIRNPAQLKRLMSNPINRRGALTAVQQQLNNKYIRGNKELVEPLKQLKHLLAHGFHHASRRGFDPHRDAHILDPIAERGYKIVEHLENTRQKMLRQGESVTKGIMSSFLKRLNQKQLQFIDKEIPSFTKLFSWYATNSRVLVSAGSIGLIISALGIAIPVFNKTMTEYEYEKLKEQSKHNPARPEPSSLPEVDPLNATKSVAKNWLPRPLTTWRLPGPNWSPQTQSQAGPFPYLQTRSLNTFQ